jgi:hypothetical protein
MAAPDKTANAFDRAREINPTCSIVPEVIEQQKERQRRLAPATVSVVRAQDCVEIQFNEKLERPTLDAMIAVENDCCPHLTFDFDDDALKLRVGVKDEEHASALDGMAEALGGRAAATR